MRRFAAALGVALAGIGLAMIAGVPLPFSMQRTFVTLTGVLTLLQGLRYASARRAVEREAASTGDPEQRTHAPVPGDDVDAGLGLPRDLSQRGSFRREDVRDRFREVAAETMEIRGVCGREEAESHLDDGTWTDDPFAARLLSAEPDAMPIPLRDRLSLLVRRESAYAHGVHRAIDEIERLQSDGARLEPERSDSDRTRPTEADGRTRERERAEVRRNGAANRDRDDARGERTEAGRDRNESRPEETR
jgi:hypothetical protein